MKMRFLPALNMLHEFPKERIFSVAISRCCRHRLHGGMYGALLQRNQIKYEIRVRMIKVNTRAAPRAMPAWIAFQRITPRTSDEFCVICAPPPAYESHGNVLHRHLGCQSFVLRLTGNFNYYFVLESYACMGQPSAGHTPNISPRCERSRHGTDYDDACTRQLYRIKIT